MAAPRVCCFQECAIVSMLDAAGAISGKTCADTVSCCDPGEPGPDKRQVWIVARQHPGESMAEWFMEGALASAGAGHGACITAA